MLFDCIIYCLTQTNQKKKIAKFKCFGTEMFNNTSNKMHFFSQIILFQMYFMYQLVFSGISAINHINKVSKKHVCIVVSKT